MVKKLIKHEFTAFTRTMLPMELILLGVALLNRIIHLFESHDTSYAIIEWSSNASYCMSLMVCGVMTVAVAISRFYKNLFTSEGYLSFTLPVTPAQHIFAKLLVACTYTVITMVTVFISICIISMGDYLVELFKAAGYLIEEMFAHNTVHRIFFAIEVLIMCVAVGVSEILKFYACISLGQRAKKNRILAAFGIYFGYYFVCQIFGTVLLIGMTSFEWEGVVKFAVNNPNGIIHIVLLLIVAFYCVMSALYFAVSRYIMQKRLNLE